MKVITARIDDKNYEDLVQIGKEEQIDRAEIMRKFLAKAIKEWKTQRALSLLKMHKITIRKAGEISGLSYVEMTNSIADSDIEMGYTLKDLRNDLNK